MFKIHQLGDAGARLARVLITMLRSTSPPDPTPLANTQEPGTHWTLQVSKPPPLLICSYMSGSQRKNSPLQAPPHGYTHVVRESIGRDPHNGLS